MQEGVHMCQSVVYEQHELLQVTKHLCRIRDESLTKAARARTSCHI